MNEAVSYLTHDYMNDDGLIYWSRLNNIVDNEGWVGIRYGAAGIIEFLCHYYKVFPSNQTRLILEKSNCPIDSFAWVFNG